VMVTPSILSDVTRSMPDKHSGRLKARLVRQPSVTIIFFGLLAIKRKVIRLCPVLYVVELGASRVLVGSWNDDVSIISILTELVS